MTIIIYKTDVHHSYSSRDMIGVATSLKKAVKIVLEQVAKEGEELDADQLFNINNIKQTQGYGGEGEFHMEEVKTNCLL